MGKTQSALEKKLPNKITNMSTKARKKLNKFQRFRSVNNVRAGKTCANNDLVIIEGCLESNKKLKILIDSGSQADLSWLNKHKTEFVTEPGKTPVFRIQDI